MLQNREIEQVNVQWKHFGIDEATWEMKNQMRVMYPSLFVVDAKLFWYDVLVYVFMIWVYVHMYMDINTTMSYVIKPQ